MAGYDPWIVCPDCDGAGKHTLHGIALTAADVREAVHDNPDFMENYASGVYDTVCETCNGRTTIRQSQLESYHDRLQEQRVMMMETGGRYAY